MSKHTDYTEESTESLKEHVEYLRGEVEEDPTLGSDLAYAEFELRQRETPA